MSAHDAGFGRKPTLAQASALVDERALADRLAEALRRFVDGLDENAAEIAGEAALAAHDAARADNP